MIRSLATFAFVGFALVFVLPLLILWSLIRGNPAFMYNVFQQALRITLRIAAIRVHTEGAENVPSGVCVFASNHCSNLDPVALTPQIPKRVGLLAKKEVFRIPILSKAIRLAGLIPVDRGNKDSASESVDAAVESLKKGLSFCVYPEGTRSVDGRLLPFKRGTFLMAIRAGVPVVPISLAGTQNLLRKGDWRLYPGEVTVRFGKPVDASNYSLEQRQELLDAVHESIAAGLPPDQKPLE
jgi:1-acyl-sn-glycerol-3-phosphate acyltransferase